MVDLVDLEQDLLHDVVPDELKVWLADQVGDVVFRAREKIVEANHVVAAFHQERAQVRPDKAGATGDEDAVGVDDYDQLQAGVA